MLLLMQLDCDCKTCDSHLKKYVVMTIPTMLHLLCIKHIGDAPTSNVISLKHLYTK
jgi:hypothetical protein